MKLRPLLRCTVLVLSLAWAGPALADRPSLIDLQAAVDGLVSPPPAAVSGTIRFVNGSIDLTFPLVDVSLSADVPYTCMPTCMPAGNTVFPAARTTFEQTAGLAWLTAEYLSSTPIQDIFVDVPSQPSLLRFTDVALQAMESDEVPGRVEVRFAYAQVQLQFGGASATWDTTLGTGSGCSIPPETHVDLAGNDPAVLQPGEVEADFALGFPSALPVLTYTRTPTFPCYLRGAGSGQTYPILLQRLWQGDGQFPGRQAALDIDLPSTFVDLWTFRVESGALREEIQLVPTGTLTTREFSPVDGSKTAETSTGF